MLLVLLAYRLDPPSRDLSVPLPVKNPLTHRAQVQVDLDVERVRHPSPLEENRWKCNQDADADMVLQIQGYKFALPSKEVKRTTSELC